MVYANKMIEITGNILTSTWELLREAGPYMLAGFFLAGVARAFLPASAVVKWLGKANMASVLRAAAVGVPLPLCSCGVIPMAAALRREGASKGAVSSFVISTPESGADSILATYALLDVPMTVVRPVAAFVTAFAAGAAELLFGRPEPAPSPKVEAESCGCDDDEAEEAAVERNRPGLAARVASGLRYAFGEMFEDMAIYLLAGFLVAGVLAALVPPAFVAERLAAPGLQIIALVVLGAPIYVCATAATPIAAVLVAKGVSPGAALAFLLAGPATNAAGLAVLTKYLGRRSVVIYLVTIILCAVAAGFALNAFYDGFGLVPVAAGAAPAEGGFDYVGTVTAAAFLLLCLNGLRLKLKSRREGDSCDD
jgi:uncharacterized membrane protein YraQ (UPF0718 family)